MSRRRRQPAHRRSPSNKSVTNRTRRLRDAAYGAAVEGLEGRQLFSVLVVNNTADGGAGSLRNAILTANANPGADQIVFALPGGSGTITPQTPLPTVTDPLTIDGRTQAGYAGTPLVEISGAQSLGGGDGLSIAAPDSVVAGLTINGFTFGAGVHVLAGARGAEIVANQIGTDASGQAPAANSDGVLIDAPGVTVTGNLISGNDSHGVWVTANGAGALITGNLIGTDATGTHALQDSELVLAFGISVDGADGVTVGGVDAGDANVIAGSGRAAVMLSGATHATVQGNLLGVDATGAYAIGQGSGIAVIGASNTVTVRGNTISAVQGPGVQIADSSHVTVAGNVIGTVTADALGNTFDDFGTGFEVQGNGVDVGGSSFVTVGGATAADRNVIAGGDGAGVQVNTSAAPVEGVVITGNYVGVLGDGVTAMGWQGNGIDAGPDGVTVTNNVVGAAEGSGIVVRGSGSVIDGNFVGVGADGVTAAANPFGDGVFLLGSNNQVIGNTIAHNFGNGVTVSAGTGNQISQNSIHDNGLLGIDLGIDGVTANDSLGHVGPNDYQNFPVLGAVMRTAGGVRVSGTLNAAPNGTFVVEFFGSTTASATGHGEGQTFLGSITVHTGAGGNGAFTTDLGPVPDGLTVISATATDAAGNTSEFAQDVAVPAARTTIPTQITLATSANPSTVGQAVTFTAAVAADSGVATGSVTFTDGNTVLGTGVLDANGAATLTTSTLAGGPHSITAVYVGQYDYLGSTSAPLAQSVNAPTVTTLAVSAPTSTFGQGVTFTATVTAPSGTVTFTDGNAVLGTVPVDSNGVAMLTVSTLGPGSHSVTAAYGGSDFYLPSTSAAVGHVVSVPTSTALSTSSPAAQFGAPVTLAATVSATTGVATGSVNFFDGTQLLGAGVLANGVAMLTTTGLALGGHSLTAVYAGDGNYLSSASPAVAVAVNTATNTALSASAATSLYGQTVTFTATVTTAPGAGTPAGTVTFYDGPTAIGSGPLNAAGVATLATAGMGIGSHSITAAYGGQPFFGASTSAPVTEVVNTTTTTTLSPSSATAQHGAAVTLTATVSAPTGVATGSVAFYDGTSLLGTGTLSGGVASLNVASLPLGGHTLTAVYGGAGNYLGSTSAPAGVSVISPTTTTLTSSAPTSVPGQAVTFTATVAGNGGTPTGSVTFYDGTTALGTGTVNAAGVATLTTSALAAGPHAVTAAYGGQGPFTGSASAPLAQVVNTTASITGLVYSDLNDNGLVDVSETGIANVKVMLTGIDMYGHAVSLTDYTDTDGLFEFAGLYPSNAAGYMVTETQPSGYTDGKDTVGTLGGAVSDDVFTAIPVGWGNSGANYNFGELSPAGPQVSGGMTATIGFWQNKNGQALIKSLNGSANSTLLGNWLAGNFPNLFGVAAGTANNLAGKNNTAVASYFTQVFKVTGMKLRAQTLAVALAVYSTDTDLAGGTYASGYGFTVNSSGTGVAMFNVGSYGSSLGLVNNTSYSVMTILTAVNNKDAFDAASSVQTATNSIMDGINTRGDI